MGERRPRGAPRPLPSVRVRITAAATLVTAVTVVATGLLLVRQVEGTQLGDLARRTSARVDEVAAALAAGQSPAEAVGAATASGTATGEVAVQVSDERGCPVAMGPVVAVRGGVAALQVGSATTVTAWTPAAARPAQRGKATMTVERADGTTVTCAVPEGPTPPADGPDPGGGAATAGTRAADDAGGPGPAPLNRLQLISQGSVSRFPFEHVSRRVPTASGTYTIEAAAPVDEVRRSVDAVRQALWWVLPALIALVAAVAWALVGRALRPVEAIRAEVEAIGGTTMHRRVPEPRSQDEVGRLARTMNAMLGRLEASARRQRQFVSDASHELRSPVATIRADLEVAQLEGAGADWPAVATSVLREEARLERLIDDLLVLAAADEGASTRRAAPVSLAAIVIEDAARARRVPVIVRVAGPEGADPAPVHGDAAQLRRVVANLVDNAARHARSRVDVTLDAEPGRCVRLTVDDDGDGIAPADRRRVFERFARLDEARARDRGGAGLGLAVVRSLVERHGGTVTVGESPTGGARLVVVLPPGRAAAPPRGVGAERTSTAEAIAP